MSDHRTILITGASGGIGLELARRAAEKGNDLVLVARSQERLGMISRDFEETYNIKVVAIEQDLSDRDAAQSLVNLLKKRKIRIDGLINNAGFGVSGRFDTNDPSRINNMMQVNMVTLTELTRLLLPGMVERGHGRILNVASTAAFLPGPLMAVYYATKAYVLSFSQALAEELEGTGVTVTALCPGPTKTHFAIEAEAQGSRLFGGDLMDARTVAQAGYDAMEDGKTVVVPGIGNKLTALGSHILPRSVLTKLAEYENRNQE